MGKPEKSANAAGAKTARACDSCLRRRARWYCASDDAFLCQPCDSSVHSANPLAKRHHRVQLKPASTTPDPIRSVLPTWHQGFNRKPRTPRHAKSSLPQPKPAPLVPDLETGADDPEAEEEDPQLLYRVPIFDPVLDDTKPVAVGNGFAGLIDPSDVELAEFAADVESLLGFGDDSFCIDALGLMDVREEEMSTQVKVEPYGVDIGSGEFDMVDRMEFSRESLDINFDCGSAGEVEGKEEEVGVDEGNGVKIGLRLDYEAVIADWSCRDCSPWIDGERPQFNLDDCWPDSIGMWGGGDAQGFGLHTTAIDKGREARVTRYREKRRTRLFSKKIRYEVRKLNAEKRPRMKGRFVKRTSFIAAGAPAGFAY